MSRDKTNNPDNRTEKSDSWISQLGLVTSLQFKVLISFLVLALIVASLALIKRSKSLTQDELNGTLQIILQTTERQLKAWHDQEKSIISSWAADEDLISLVEQLLLVPEKIEPLSAAQPQLELRDEYQRRFSPLGYEGFFIINRDSVSIGSTRDSNLGTKNLLASQKRFLKAVFEGKALISNPMVSDVPLPGLSDSLVAGRPTMFSAAPVRNARGEIIAVLTLRLSPHDSYTTLIQARNFRETGDTYVFDDQGRMLSESRFLEQLWDAGILPRNQSSVLTVEVRDPGINLLSGRSGIPLSDRPLTRMAHSAIQGNTDVDLLPYHDYRGVDVIGAWLWDHENNFGLTTEIDYAEAYRSFDHTRSIIIGALIGALFLLASLTALLGINQRQAIQVAATEREAARLIRRSHEEVSLANQNKDRLFSILAHDLRGSLGNFRELTNLMLDDNMAIDEASGKEIISDMHNQAKSLFSLLENLLTWSRLQLGLIKAEPRHLAVNELLRRTKDDLEPLANSKDVIIYIRSSEGSPEIEADWDQMLIVLRNLGANAIKYSSAGDTVQLGSEIDTGSLIHIYVKDQGTGIPAAYLPTLFNVDNVYRKAGTSGEATSGLGLPLVKDFTEKNGGRVKVDSKEDVGSRFTLSFPLIQKPG